MAVRKRVETDLRSKITELADADRRKNEFLAMLGHELRNPLSAVLNAITAADLDESHRDRAIDIARRQTAQLTRLVDDLLDVARITQGRIALRKERVTVVEYRRAGGRGNPRRRGSAPAAPRYDRCHPILARFAVDVDSARMQQVISNLIQNASKFTPARGRIEVSGTAPGRRRGDSRARYRHRHRARDASARVRSFRAGRRRDGSRAGRPRYRA